MELPATWEWIEAFMAHSSPHLGALACFMFLTGARISEALNVAWRDVDFERQTVRIVMGTYALVYDLDTALAVLTEWGVIKPEVTL